MALFSQSCEHQAGALVTLAESSPAPYTRRRYRLPPLLNTPDFSYTDGHLEASELRCERGYRTLFEGLGFSVGSGRGLQIGGANGAGKTSLLRILATLGYAEHGHISWNGDAISKSRSLYRSELAFLGHRQALKTELTATENLMFHSQLCAPNSNQQVTDRQADYQARKTEIVEALDYFGIGKARNRPVRQLSAGQRQRVALARVALTRVPLWILDEPATALDDQGIDLLCNLINRHLERNGLVVFSSHQSLAVSSGPVSRMDIQ